MKGGSSLKRARIILIHEPAWKTLISRYMVAIPPSGDACTFEHNASAGLPPDILVRMVIAAKIGEATSPKPSAILTAAVFRAGGRPPKPLEQSSLMV